MAEIVEALRQRQGELSQRSFAKQIGISQSTLWRLYHGKPIGPGPARRVAAAIPELQMEIALYLLRGDIPSESQ